MTDRPIDLPSHRIPALLDGRMTQYRVPIEPEWLVLPDVPPVPWSEMDAPATMERLFTIGDRIRRPVYPPHAIGDRLWLRERWATDGPRIIYPDTDDVHPLRTIHESQDMFRWMSRITLTVTDLAVHRVQGISEADAEAEGMRKYPGEGHLFTNDLIGPKYEVPLWFSSAIAAFHDLYNTTHGPGAWDRNDWVLATTFRVDLCNIDQMEEADG